MSRKFIRQRSKKALLTAILVSASISLAGCYGDDYHSRRDTITLGAGDAAQTNAATHTVDPWPAHSRNTDIHIEGRRAEVGIERYQQNKSIQPGKSGKRSSGSNKATIKITQ